MTPPHFIINPAAAAGRARRWWAAAESVLRRHFPGMTAAISGDDHSLADLLVLATQQGHDFIIGVGGDGTHHDLVNALVANNLLDQVTYAPLPLGSGNDWCRTLGIPRHILRWVDVIKQGNTINHSIGKLTYSRGAGPSRLSKGLADASQVQHFINVAGLAYDAEVVRRSGTLPVRHRWMYPFLTLAYLKGFTPPELELRYDDQLVTGRFHTINLGIGRYNGGGMRLVPQADPTADTLALTYARNLPISRIVANGWRFYTPTIGKVRGVTTTHARRVTITGSTQLEADGEWLGTTPVTVELIDQRLRVVCG